MQSEGQSGSVTCCQLRTYVAQYLIHATKLYKRPIFQTLKHFLTDNNVTDSKSDISRSSVRCDPACRWESEDCACK